MCKDGERQCEQCDGAGGHNCAIHSARRDCSAAELFPSTPSQLIHEHGQTAFHFDYGGDSGHRPCMTGTEIIREIEALPQREQDDVIRFAYRLGTRKKLTPAELGSLAERLAATTDSEETAVLREEIVQGFYGGRVDA